MIGVSRSYWSIASLSGIMKPQFSMPTTFARPTQKHSTTTNGFNAKPQVLPAKEENGLHRAGVVVPPDLNHTALVIVARMVLTTCRFQLPTGFSLVALAAQTVASDLQVSLSVRKESFVASVPGRALMSGFPELAAGQEVTGVVGGRLFWIERTVKQSSEIWFNVTKGKQARAGWNVDGNLRRIWMPATGIIPNPRLEPEVLQSRRGFRSRMTVGVFNSCDVTKPRQDPTTTVSKMESVTLEASRTVQLEE